MEQDWQKKYEEFQQLQQHIEQISQQLQLMSQQATEIENTKEALSDLANVKEGSEMLAPISNGIFVKSKVMDVTKLVVNVGANITVEKTIPEMLELFEKQKVDITKQLVEGEIYLQKLQDQATTIFKEVQVEDVDKI